MTEIERLIFDLLVEFVGEDKELRHKMLVSEAQFWRKKLSGPLAAWQQEQAKAEAAEQLAQEQYALLEQMSKVRNP